MNKMGFELKISGCTYFVKCDTTTITNTSERDTSNKVNLRIRVFEEGKFVKLDKDSYVAEKIVDFIKNCINGQDSCYWDWDEPNRHLEEPKHYLKWEDLVFDASTSIKVKMGDTQYSLSLRRTRSKGNSVVLRDDDLIAYLLLYEKDKQFFNDLHLELVEEYDEGE